MLPQLRYILKRRDDPFYQGKRPDIMMKYGAVMFWIMIALFTLAVTGCISQPYGFFEPHPKLFSDYYLPQEDPNIKDIWIDNSQAEGEACSTNLFGLITFGDSTVEKASQNLVERNKVATILYSWHFEKRFETYFGIYSIFCTKVSGITAYRSSEGKARCEKLTQ
jgi:hypothetical protein